MTISPNHYNCIYLLTSPSGKHYIGQAKNFKNRMAQHKAMKGECYRLYKAIAKYGFEAFTKEILAEDIETQEELDELEMYYIAEYNSIEQGYNITAGGCGAKRPDGHNINFETGKYGISTFDPDYYKINARTWYQEHPEQAKKSRKKYHEDHRDEILKQKKEYRTANRDKINRKQRESYYANHDKRKKQYKEYYDKNKDVIRKRQRDYIEKNRDKILEQQKEYREKNRDERNARNKAYYHRNSDVINAKRRKDYEEHKDVINDRNKAYYEKHKDEINAKRKAKRILEKQLKQTNSGQLSLSDF